MNTVDDELLKQTYSQAEVKQILKVSDMTLYRWRKSGTIKSIVYPKKTIRYYKEDIEKILKGGL